MELNEQSKKLFQSRLLEWFDREQRIYPWRLQKDPYAILVAEKLLQQTEARETVVAAYHKILENYPTPKDLAEAPLPVLESIIRPLGFVYRAAHMKEMASEIVSKYDGRIPRDLNVLLSIKGVGDYSARAVLSFAYGEDVPIVDTNVARFLYRLYGIEGKFPSNPSRKKSLIAMAGSLVPEGRSKKHNLAILDLCAAICKPKNPACEECPVLCWCDYGRKKTKLPDRRE